MKPLNQTYFPVAGMNNLIFKTTDGLIHRGRYDFNDNKSRRWFDEYNNEYTSNYVSEWTEVKEVTK